MRLVLCALALLLASATLSACPARPRDPASGARTSGAAGHGFSLALPAEALEGLAAASPRELRQLFSDATGTRLAGVPRGSAGGLLYCNLTSQPTPARLSLPGKLLCVDCDKGSAYCLEAGSGEVVRLSLAGDGAPPETLPALPAGQHALAAATREGRLFLLSAEETVATAESPAAGPAAPAAEAEGAQAGGAEAEAAAAAAAETEAAAAGLAPETAHSASPPVLGGAAGHVYEYADGGYKELLATALGALDPARPPQLAALPGGAVALYLPEGRMLWLLGPDFAKDKALAQIGELGDAILAPDAAQPVAWLYARPQDAGAGSGRAQHTARDGEVVAIGAGGTQLARYRVGSVPFSQLAGDIAKQRCLLALSSAGVAQVFTDPARASEPKTPGALDAGMAWLLRHGGDAPLFLSGGQIWAALESGLYGIAADELIRQAPQLAAGQTLPREQVKALRKAADVLGWDWKGVQVSPLAGFESRLVLYDTASRDAATAELAWDAARQRASHVLLTRPPASGDTALLKAPPADIEAACTGMLAALGWPGAVLDSSGVVQDEYSAAASYELDPASPDGGSFSLWVTDSVTLVTLEAGQADD